MNASLILEQLKELSRDLWRAIQGGESLDNVDRMQLENALTLLQLSAMESKYRSDQINAEHFDGGQSDQRCSSTTN